METRRITDILPPKSFEPPKEKKEIKEVRKEEPKISEPKDSGTKDAIPFSKSGLVFTLISVGIFCGAIAIGYFTLSRADISVWPETKTLTFETKVTVDKTAASADFSAKIIPGEIFEKEKILKENFVSSGKEVKETKAEGIVRVYNNYSVSPQIFVVNTRFVSTDGKIFRTPLKVTIPGGAYEGGKLVAGEIDIKVVADEAGPEYNIGPTTFSIPGLAGTEKYTKFYAKSFQAMTGGFSEEVPKVTKEDLQDAENYLVKKAEEECEALLKTELESEKISSEFYYLEQVVQTEIVEKFSLTKVGDEAKNFDFQVKAKSKTLIFKKEDLNNFAKEFLESKIPGNTELPGTPKIYEESLKIDFTPETIGLNSDKIVLALDTSATIYSDVDIDVLKSGLEGKSLLESKNFLENQSGVNRAGVEFWPFWVKSVPKSPDKINFKLNID